MKSTYLIILSCVIFNLVFLINSTKYVEENFEAQFTRIKNIENNICSPSFCKNESSTSPAVLKFCKTYSIIQRCCVKNSTKNSTAIIGLDYTNCNINGLINTVGSLNKDLIMDIELLDVRSNPLTDCGISESFAGFLKLETLYLTDSTAKICECPGTNFSWTNTNNGTCTGRKNLCNTSFSPTINCTQNSACAENGPGNFRCDCRDGFHGYKCLNEGTFPKILFTSIICFSTLFLSGLLWHSQRRNVKCRSN